MEYDKIKYTTSFMKIKYMERTPACVSYIHRDRNEFIEHGSFYFKNRRHNTWHLRVSKNTHFMNTHFRDVYKVVFTCFGTMSPKQLCAYHFTSYCIYGSVKNGDVVLFGHIFM